MRWRLVVTVAEPGDPTNDATQAWPAIRRQVEVRTLSIDSLATEAPGNARDVNFDPLVLPLSRDSKKPAPRRGFLIGRLLDGANALGLRALLPLADLELDALPLLEGLEAGAGNLGVVDENVRTAAVLRDKPEALFAVEPLHTALRHTVCFTFL
jgi:hypothetical protein